MGARGKHKMFKHKDYLPFEEARKIARSMKLLNSRAWGEIRATRPKGIPSNPHNYYKGKGWAGYADFLGYEDKRFHGDYSYRTGRATRYQCRQSKKFLSYEEAKAYVKKLDIRNIKRWNKYIQSEFFPEFLPKRPDYHYREAWTGYTDFLGDKYLSYEDAKKAMREHQLPCARDFWKMKNKPEGVPWNPRTYYKSNGWISWMDFLGKYMSNPDIDEQCVIRGNLKVYPKHGIVENVLSSRNRRKGLIKDYKVAKLHNKTISEHRLIYMVGHNLTRLPKGAQIDHIDDNTHNNKLENLQMLFPRMHNTKTSLSLLLKAPETINLDSIVFFDRKTSKQFRIKSIKWKEAKS